MIYFAYEKYSPDLWRLLRQIRGILFRPDEVAPVDVTPAAREDLATS